MPFEVTTFYKFDGSFAQDDVAEKAVGREHDESGWGCGERDIGWICRTEGAANKIKAALEKIGMPVSIFRFDQ
jgi:hypothetical protein